MTECQKMTEQGPEDTTGRTGKLKAMSQKMTKSRLNSGREIAMETLVDWSQLQLGKNPKGREKMGRMV